MDSRIEWNFTKFLIGRGGEVIARFAPRTGPTDPEVVSAIEAALDAASWSLPPCPPDHSCRSAATGSTRAARREGYNPDATLTARAKQMAPPIIHQGKLKYSMKGTPWRARK